MHPDTIEKLAVTNELIGGRQMSDAMIDALIAALDHFGDEAVCLALDRCVRECKGWLAPADIISRIDDGRPGPDEAWALCPKTEAESAIWTDEMADAWGVVSGLVDAGDLVAARRSFLDAYEKRVKQARDRRRPVRWTPTLGNDPAGRERALRAAVDAGKLSPRHVAGLLPEPEYDLPQLSGKSGKVDMARIGETIKKLRGYGEWRSESEKLEAAHDAIRTERQANRAAGAADPATGTGDGDAGDGSETACPDEDGGRIGGDRAPDQSGQVPLSTEQGGVGAAER